MQNLIMYLRKFITNLQLIGSLYLHLLLYIAYHDVNAFADQMGMAAVDHVGPGVDNF